MRELQRPFPERAVDVAIINRAEGVRYTGVVRSVADDLRARTMARVLDLPIRARIALALSLGDEDLKLFVRANGLERREAVRRLRAQRALGRTPSVAAGVQSR
jgi:hypothetical protein